MPRDLLAVILAMQAHRAFYLFSWISTTHLLYFYIFYFLSLSLFLVVGLFMPLGFLSKMGINTKKEPKPQLKQSCHRFLPSKLYILKKGLKWLFVTIGEILKSRFFFKEREKMVYCPFYSGLISWDFSFLPLGFTNCFWSIMCIPSGLPANPLVARPLPPLSKLSVLSFFHYPSHDKKIFVCLFLLSASPFLPEWIGAQVSHYLPL